MKKVFLIIIISSCLFINAQEKAKDTLFFKYNKKYIKERIIDTDTYYVLKDSNNDGTFFFLNTKTHYALNPKKILNLKKFVRQSKFYNRKKYRKLNDFGLSRYLGNYVVFLVKGKQFIEVNPGTEHE